MVTKQVTVLITPDDFCPIILDVSDGSLTDVNGNAVTAGIEIKISDSKITVTHEAFHDCYEDHTHELIVLGSSEATSVSLEENSSVPYDVYISGVSVKQMDIKSMGNLIFIEDEQNTFRNTEKPDYWI